MINETKLIEALNEHKEQIKRKRLVLNDRVFSYYIDKLIEYINKLKVEESWFSEMIKPEENKWVVVRDDDGKEYPFHKWNGTYWYAFIGDDENGYDGWRTDVDVISWRYQ